MGQSDQIANGACVETLQAALDRETLRADELQRQLDRAGAEFEEFVSMAAHNLRDSLRDVASFSQLMAETHTSRLDSEASMCLDRIREGAARAQSLLSDVVNFCVADTRDRTASTTDAEAALCQALLSTNKQIAERAAIVTYDPLPAVMADFGLLANVFDHLIRNAIEYCVAPSPQLHISSRREHHDWVFSVQDHGPGIDPAVQARIFMPFKRLHGKEHPGNGLGLAFCKKAIEWHGGRIWVESVPGMGSTFYFTLPAAD